MDLPIAQRAVSILAALLFVLAVGIGLWPVSVTIVGGTAYSCGSGFDHSRHTWTIDSQGLPAATQGADSSSATPSSACPSRVYGHRDLAILLGGFSVLAGAAALALGPPLDPSVRRRNQRARSRTAHPLR
jgi:hypothetical protein